MKSSIAFRNAAASSTEKAWAIQTWSVSTRSPQLFTTWYSTVETGSEESSITSRNSPQASLPWSFCTKASRSAAVS
jgi:hypothetical protein